MHCIVTAGPTFEPLDAVRRLTNFSTGSLGTELAAHLARCGAKPFLLRGVQSTCTTQPAAVEIANFTTTSDLGERLRAATSSAPRAIFHTAAVSDFQFGRVWEDAERNRPLAAGKLSTRSGSLFAELVPTPKLLPQLRNWHPDALIVGWKFEVDGDRAAAVEKARNQIRDCRTDACVVNGPAFGEGFGLLSPNGELQLIADRPELYRALGALMGLGT